MPYLLNLVYLFIILLISPWLIYKALTTGKYRRGMGRKFWGLAWRNPDRRPCVWFHGVSVGEIHLLRPVVARFRQRLPTWQVVVSTTTDTGYAEAEKHFPDLPVFYWPLDFTWTVRRALRRVRPELVVLAEGEAWPNFVHSAKQQGVKIAVINGRISPRSWRHYELLGRWLPVPFPKLDLIAAQNEEYAEAYRALGVDAWRVHITGSVKFDGVTSDRHNPRTEALRQLFHVTADDIIWIAGSTQTPEEEHVLAIFRQLKPHFPALRLFLVPRQRDRFDEVAGLLNRFGHPYVRRSALTDPLLEPTDLVLVDTIGELGALWGLADVAFVGGSMDGKRGGQNMLEPAAYGAAVVFGSHVWNFRHIAAQLVQAGAARQITDAAELAKVIEQLCRDPQERQRLGSAARDYVLRQQGATERTLDLLHGLLRTRPDPRRAAG